MTPIIRGNILTQLANTEKMIILILKLRSSLYLLTAQSFSMHVYVDRNVSHIETFVFLEFV